MKVITLSYGLFKDASYHGWEFISCARLPWMAPGMEVAILSADGENNHYVWAMLEDLEQGSREYVNLHVDWSTYYSRPAHELYYNPNMEKYKFSIYREGMTLKLHEGAP